MTTTKLTAKGQIALPTSVREELGLRSGMEFMVISDDDYILLKPLRVEDDRETRRMLANARRSAEAAGLREEDIAEAIKKVRAASKR